MYKLELISVKYVPIITALTYAIVMILSYFDFNTRIFDVLFGNSLITTVPMYISSYVYKF